MTRLLIIQPYAPSYRVPFFRELRASLADVGVEMRLAAGRPDAAAQLRQDDRPDTEVDFALEESRIGLGRRTAIVRRLGPAVAQWAPELVIIEQAIKNVEAYPLLARAFANHGPRVAMWGHGRTYSTPQTAAEAAVKRWLTRRADWFFAYTQGGAQYVIDHGYPSDRVTVVRNTFDTAALQADLAAVEPSDLEGFRSRLDLTPGRTALFLGGVDEHKGISFLLSAARTIADALPGFVLLVGGSGAQEPEVVREQEAGGPVRYLGRVDGEAKVLALRAADVLLVPEWIGLVAVDSLVSGVPIITTRHHSHSPEHEYLTDGRTAVFAEHDVSAYAQSVISLLGDSRRLQSMREACRVEAVTLSLTGMVGRFRDGVAEWVARPAR